MSLTDIMEQAKRGNGSNGNLKKKKYCFFFFYRYSNRGELLHQLLLWWVIRFILTEFTLISAQLEVIEDVCVVMLLLIMMHY